MQKKAESPAFLSLPSTRREFLRRSLCIAAGGKLICNLTAGETKNSAEHKLRAAIIGDTDHGNYGHEHEVIFNGRENITVVAIADPHDSGRAKAAARTHALRQYADYRQMIQKEKPQLVCVAPRWTDKHYEMGLTSVRAGAHIYLEKPITQTLREADELLEQAKQRGLKIAVAHQMRLAPNILFLKKCLEDGVIGELLEIRAHGKQDQRAGGEDLLVLGVHLFDLMRFFARDALWCAAQVLQKGHEITLSDAHPASEHIGPIVGDKIFAQFAFSEGVNATFTSGAKNREVAGPWGMELIGTKGALKIIANIMPAVYARKIGSWSVSGQTSEWRALEKDPTLALPEYEKSVGGANKRVVDDWLEAIAQDREPICSGYAGMKALEMVMAVFAAGLSRGRVELPLRNREHPLGGSPGVTRSESK